MSFFSRIANSIQKNLEAQKISASNADRLMQSVIQGFNANETSNQIEQRIASLALTPDDVRRAGPPTFSQLIETIAQNGRFSPQQESTLLIVANRLGIPSDVVTRSFQRLSLCRLSYDIERGGLPSVQVSGLMLHKGESACWSEPAAILDERVVDRQYVGGYAGVSFRVTRGVYFRTGGVRGHIETRKGIVPTSTGRFVLTNQRLIFLGDAMSIDVPWSKILNVDFYQDGIRISQTGRSKPTLIRFDHAENTEVIGQLISRIMNEVT